MVEQTPAPPNVVGLMEKMLSLFDLNQKVRLCLDNGLAESYWVVAEIFDKKLHSNGHCYLELVEKDPFSNRLLAKAQGIVWAQRFYMLQSYFEAETGRSFEAGLKVLLNVSVQMHPLYGYALVVNDIDPSYTLGEMVRRQQEVIKQLKADGVLDMNKGLPMPRIPQRIAIISSDTAAGYEDFMTHLHENKGEFVFYTTLFRAYMQGEQAEQSIIRALDRVYSSAQSYDVVVIVRGGGASSDLNCFDSYELCNHCAQFPLPIISGIGHERDVSVLDQVVHTRMKTPTAVATFLIACMEKEQQLLLSWQERLVQLLDQFERNAWEQINRLQKELYRNMQLAIERALHQQQLYNMQLSEKSEKYGLREKHRIEFLQQRMASLYNYLWRKREGDQLLFLRERLSVALLRYQRKKAQDLELMAEKLKWISPDRLLQQGYTLTEKNGSLVTSVKDLKPGDTIVTYLRDGKIISTVK